MAKKSYVGQDNRFIRQVRQHTSLNLSRNFCDSRLYKLDQKKRIHLLEEDLKDQTNITN